MTELPMELVQQWRDQAPWAYACGKREDWLMARAARWSADQQLRACCKLLNELGGDGDLFHRHLRPAPTLRQQALKELQALEEAEVPFWALTSIRRALEAMPEVTA